jgi:hypothetical protein
LINLYGQTETTGDVTCAVLTEMPQAVVNGVVSVGKPILDDTSIELAGDDNELIVEGNLSNGYLSSSSQVTANNVTTGPFTRFATGDVGFQHSDNGCWYVQGRKDEVVKINGILTSPVQVEAAMSHVFVDAVFAAAALNVVVEQYQVAYYCLVNRPIDFSRQALHFHHGVPWHLIPKQVFVVDSIPTSATSGAGKVDRARVCQMIQERLNDEKHHHECNDQSFSKTSKFIAILQDTLQCTIQNDDDDMSKSFVDLGGDSAAAVTFLYQLKVAKLLSSQSTLSAVDILRSESIKDLQDAVEGKVAPKDAKRQKLDDDDNGSGRSNNQVRHFRPRPPTVYYKKNDVVSHIAFDFGACVDAPPLVHGDSIYAACQAGVIQRIRGNKVVGCHDLGDDWRVQAGMILFQGFVLVVCAYCQTRRWPSDTGLIVGLSLDLKEVYWKKHTEESIKVTPVVVKNRLWVQTETQVTILEIRNDVLPAISSYSSFVATSVSKPAIIENQVVYACNDDSGWKSNLLIMPAQMEETKATFTHGIFESPVMRDITLIQGGEKIAVCDRCGHIYIVNVQKPSDRQQRLISNKPLSSPLVTSEGKIVVGGNDGNVHCILASDLAKDVWSCNVGACVLATPVEMPDGSFVVCTTAGDILRLSSNDGKIVWRHRIHGEIWTNPVAVEPHRIAFGARDSRLHIVRIGL